MKILLALSRFPYPLEKGDKLRSYMQLKELSKTHEVHLFCLSLKAVSQEQMQAVAPFCKSIHVERISLFSAALRLVYNLVSFSSKPFQVSLFYSEKIQAAYDRCFERIIPDLLYCQMIRTALLAKKYHIYPRLLDYMDCLSLGMKRRMQQSKNPFKRFVFRLEYQKLKRFESECFEHFSMKTIISEQDREAIHHPKNKEITIIKNGVDLEFFKQERQKNKYDLVFVGNMSYPPNVAAAKYLCHTLVPRLKKEFPELKVLIAGARPNASVKALASKHITVSGWLDDIRSAYLGSKIFVAPMELGSGLQNKILEAMASGTACICSKLANKAIQATSNKHLISCSNTTDYTTSISNLLKDKSKREKLGKSGQAFVQEQYRWDAINQKLIELIDLK